MPDGHIINAMKLYFVRHGETKLNEQKIQQGRDAELSPKGVQQAKFVANRFRDIPVDIIISSPFLRAQQTTEEINNVLHKQVFYTELLGEVRRPKELEGKKMDDPESVRLKKMLMRNARLKDWHYSDEENFHDLKTRAIEFFGYLNLFKEENILAVTHSVFLRMLIGLILFGDTLNHDEFHHLQLALKTINTGITVCERNQEGMWGLVTWNDHAHLG